MFGIVDVATGIGLVTEPVPASSHEAVRPVVLAATIVGGPRTFERPDSAA